MKSTKKLSKQDRIKFWTKHVKAYSSTGLTQRAYCRKNNLSYWSFNTWKRKLENERSNRALIEIPTSIKSCMSSFNNANNGTMNFEIILRNGLKISIPETFNPKILKQILTVAGELS